ncbi:MAG: exo-beta-N-acetylmuramidase NamZ domain-containing protein [Bacteroidota bacterium]
MEKAKRILSGFGLIILFGEVIFAGHNPILPGAERITSYLPLLEGNKIGVVANHTSMIGNSHLVDSLLSHNINVVKIFTPEHGFRGDQDAGKKIEDAHDTKTRLPLVSLYGKNFKPTPGQLKGLDIILFDLQDVGVRYYTYISTLHYVMEACAENNIPVIVLDRPNPNGFYVDGPVLEDKHKSFVGLHPVPVVYGLTIGEFATMINGEGWLKDNVTCNLKVIKCDHYTRDSYYQLPVKPSPNLPDMLSVYLYPSLGFFEGTIMNVGRGTVFPFKVIGHPDYPYCEFSYMPKSRPGETLYPKHEGKVCCGIDLRMLNIDYIKRKKQIKLDWLIKVYREMWRDEFFNSYFKLLAGTNQIQSMIIEGKSVEEIRESWQDDLNKYLAVRAKYLIYPD